MEQNSAEKVTERKKDDNFQQKKTTKLCVEINFFKAYSMFLTGQFVTLNCESFH
jgi:hypothetical protein